MFSTHQFTNINKNTTPSGVTWCKPIR